MTKKDFFRGLLALAAIPMTMASCSSDDGSEPVPNPTPSEPEYVTINSVGVCELNSRAEVAATDSHYGNLFLWFDSGRDDARYNASCMEWTASSKSPQYTSYDGSVLLWGGGSAKFVALTGDSGWNKPSYSGDAEDQSFENGSALFIDDTHFVYASQNFLGQFRDLLVAQGTTTSPSLDIQVKHATAKVVFKTNYKLTFNDYGRIEGGGSQCYIHNAILQAIGTIDYEKGVLWDLSKYSQRSIMVYTDSTKEYAEAVFYLIPQTVDNLVFELSGVDGVLLLDDPQTFEANKVYEYNVVVGDSNAELTGLSVSTWDDVESAGSFITE